MKRKHYLLSVEIDGERHYAQRNPRCFTGYQLTRERSEAQSFGEDIRRRWLKQYPSGLVEELSEPVRPDLARVRELRERKPARPAKSTPAKVSAPLSSVTLPWNARQQEEARKRPDAVAIVEINPILFLELTTTGADEKKKILEESKPLEFWLSPDVQSDLLTPPYLAIRPSKKNQIVAHEGRHRAAAVANAGGYRFPILLEVREGKRELPRSIRHQFVSRRPLELSALEKAGWFRLVQKLEPSAPASASALPPRAPLVRSERLGASASSMFRRPAPVPAPAPAPEPAPEPMPAYVEAMERQWLERKPFLLLEQGEEVPQGYRIVELVGPGHANLSTDDLINLYRRHAFELPIQTPYSDPAKRRKFLEEEAARIGNSIAQSIGFITSKPLGSPSLVTYYREDPELAARMLREKDERQARRERFSQELNAAPEGTTVLLLETSGAPKAYRKVGTSKFSWRELFSTGRGFRVEQYLGGGVDYGQGGKTYQRIVDFFAANPERVEIILPSDPRAKNFRLEDEVGPGGVDLDPDLIKLMRNYRRSAEEIASFVYDLNKLPPAKKRAFRAFGYRSPPRDLREYANKIAAREILAPASNEGTILLIESPPMKGFKHRGQGTWIFQGGTWKPLRMDNSSTNFAPFNPSGVLAENLAKAELEEDLSDSKPFVSRGFKNYTFFGPGHPDRALYLDQSPDGSPTDLTRRLLRSFLSGNRKKDAPGGVIKGWRAPEFHHLMRGIRAGWLERASESNEEAKFSDKGKAELA